MLNLFKRARLFPPHKVNTMLPTASDIAFSPIPFLNYVRLNDLKSELPSYIAHATDLDPEICSIH